jgi:DNA-binding MarR family transcriptional regulator
MSNEQRVNTDLEQDVADFWSLLFQIITDAEKRLAANIATHNLTPPQFFVLKTLTEHGGRYPIGQIAREHHLTNATMTGLINRLEAMTPPLVKRERSRMDARSVDVVLTPAGIQKFIAVQQDLMKQAQAVLGMLSAEERRQAIEKVRLYFQIWTEQFPLSSE